MSDNPNFINLKHQDSTPPLMISIFSGTRWAALSQVGVQAIKFLVLILLARLLVPQDFGLMAMALVVTGFMEIFKDLGIAAAIVQKKELSAELLSSLFFINLFLGFITGGSIAAGAPIAAWIYGDNRLIPILMVLGITFIISSFSLMSRALLQREMRFDKLALVELSTVLIQGLVAIVLAVFGFGVWSLVGSAVAGSIISTVLLWVMISWKPQFFFKWEEITPVFQFSLNLTGANILNYFIINTDRIIIGRFLGAISLGFYELAQRILMTPVKTITQVLTSVLFPAFTKIQDDNIQIQQKYLRACGAIALVSFPALGGLVVLARPFVLTIFGSKWNSIIPLIIILAPVGIIKSIASTVSVIYMTKGRTDWLFRWQMVAGICLTLGFLCGLHWGVVGVAYGYLIAMVLLTYPGFAIPFRLIDLRFTDLVFSLRPYILTTIIMMSVVLAVRIYLESFGFNTKIVFITCTVIGFLVYSTIILFKSPQALSDFMKMIFTRGLSKRVA